MPSARYAPSLTPTSVKRVHRSYQLTEYDKQLLSLIGEMKGRYTTEIELRQQVLLYGILERALDIHQDDEGREGFSALGALDGEPIMGPPKSKSVSSIFGSVGYSRRGKDAGTQGTTRPLNVPGKVAAVTAESSKTRVATPIHDRYAKGREEGGRAGSQKVTGRSKPLPELPPPEEIEEGDGEGPMGGLDVARRGLGSQQREHGKQLKRLSAAVENLAASGSAHLTDRTMKVLSVLADMIEVYPVNHGAGGPSTEARGKGYGDRVVRLERNTTLKGAREERDMVLVRRSRSLVASSSDVVMPRPGMERAGRYMENRKRRLEREGNVGID
ncbi:hypothetical protein DFP72DRAFT_1133133 [Ephemerocybe angulata]|uniref:Uncharacterized protein n=1 Tax=Ephemerocybe angulata TaxID=980116 RepID=A0A8H6HVP2_9AGAR|nr:hypothetical protein DFP72DRAFT_1133133 [Tulosesus angulatus]